MPIKTCKLPDGGSGFQWGDSGKCYAARADAEKQAEAAHANGYTGDHAITFDRASVRQVDQDGHLHVADSAISKSNVCPYYGREIPDYEKLGLDADKIYKLYRDPKALEAAAASFHGKPLLIKHRAQMASDHDAGTVVGSIMNPYWEAPYLRAELVVWPGEAIDAIESDRQKELSPGYRYRADMTPGVIDGVAFDGRMVDILGNHVAMVCEGRTGSDVVVGDSQLLEVLNMAKKTLSSKAKFVKGAVFAHLLPKLATDANPKNLSMALDTMLADVASDNWKKKRPEFVGNIEKIIKATSGPIVVKDAALEDVVKLLDIVDNAGDLTSDSEWTDEHEKQYQDLSARRPKQAADADETEEEKKKREAAEAEAKKKEGGAMDENMVSKEQMAAAVNTAVKTAEDSAITRMRAISTAEDEVRPYVGKVIAQDSAEAVYKAALDILKVDIAGVPASAYRHILLAQPKPGTPRIAHDAVVSNDFGKRFPEVTNIALL